MISCRRGGTTPSRLARRRRTIGHGRSSPRAEEVLGASKQPKNTTTKGGRAHHAGHRIEELDQPERQESRRTRTVEGWQPEPPKARTFISSHPNPISPGSASKKTTARSTSTLPNQKILGFHPGDGSGGRGQPGPQQRLHGGSRRPKASTSLSWASQPRVSPGLELPPSRSRR